MDAVNKLVIIGYGFGDRGINTKIIEWIYSNKNNKILIVHPEINKLKQQARGAISNKWDRWLEEKKLVLINKPIENTRWEDIKSSLE